MKTVIRMMVLAVCLYAGITYAQPTPPGPPGNPGTNGGPVGVFYEAPNTNIITTSSNETLYVDTFPATPDPTQVLPSWATIRSGGLTLDTNGFIVDTNATPGDFDGLPGGLVSGIVVGDTNSSLAISRGSFLVLLTNNAGQLVNTKFEVKIMRNATDFSDLFHEEMAVSEFAAGDTNIVLTPVTGTANSNLFRLDVRFPSFVVGAPRVVSIRTEPMDFQLPFSQLQWVIGNGTNWVYTTDNLKNLVLVTNVPAVRLWTKTVTGIGINQATCLTPMALNLFVTPGTIITTSPNNASGPFVDSILPDAQGFGGADMSQF